jgi:hypothetical protein
VASNGAGGLRLALEPGVDPLAVLDAARSAGRVRDFALAQPSLAELFLEWRPGDDAPPARRAWSPSARCASASARRPSASSRRSSC